jgi:hypothetical protein
LRDKPRDQLTAGERGLLESCGTLITLPGSQAAELVDEAVPRIEKPAARIGIGAAQQQYQNISIRLTQLRGAMVGPATAAASFGIDGQRIDGQQLAALFDSLTDGGASGDDDGLGGRWGFFVNGSLGKGERDQTQGEDGFDFDVSNITAGADYRITEPD